MFRMTSCLRALILNPTVSGDIWGAGGGDGKFWKTQSGEIGMKLGGKNKHKS